jgi:hypothetical protein
MVKTTVAAADWSLALVSERNTAGRNISACEGGFSYKRLHFLSDVDMGQVQK